MQQNNAAAAAAALYDHPHPAGGAFHGSAPVSDAGDAVMARWLQSAGLQHLASPVAAPGIDQRLLPNLLMQVRLDRFSSCHISSHAKLLASRTQFSISRQPFFAAYTENPDIIFFYHIYLSIVRFESRDYLSSCLVKRNKL